jgi:hypothetical protein
MQRREVAAEATEEVVVTVEVVTVEVVTEAEGIFMGVAISVAMAACILAAGATSVADRLRDRVFAALVLSRSITPDRLPRGR